MRKGKSGIQKRPSREREVRIPIKKKTAENIVAMNNAVAKAQAELANAQREQINHVLPILTENGYERARVVEVSDKEPFYLVVMVPK